MHFRPCSLSKFVSALTHNQLNGPAVGAETDTSVDQNEHFRGWRITCINNVSLHNNEFQYILQGFKTLWSTSLLIKCVVYLIVKTVCVCVWHNHNVWRHTSKNESLRMRDTRNPIHSSSNPCSHALNLCSTYFNQDAKILALPWFQAKLSLECYCVTCCIFLFWAIETIVSYILNKMQTWKVGSSARKFEPICMQTNPTLISLAWRCHGQWGNAKCANFYLFKNSAAQSSVKVI